MGFPKFKRQRRQDTPKSKAAILKASPSIVGLITHDVPDDMSSVKYAEGSTCKFVLWGCGIILDSHLDTITTTTTSAATYVSTILAPAVLFKRTNDIQPSQVEIDVSVSGGKLYKGQLLVCDFHYNLAAIRIQSKSALKPAIFRALNDVSSINIESSGHRQSHGGNPFLRGLRPHTNLFKVQSGTKIIILHSSFDPFSVIADCGVFRSFHKISYSCKELYWVDCAKIAKKHSGAVINFSGKFLGIMFHNSSFLPSNFISRWWNNYTSTRELCRPWVGVEISNLSEACLSFLEEIRNTFSDISTGVVVKKVEKDSPAYSSGLQLEDVIVKCDEKKVESKIEFFERIWDNAGKAVKLTILRVTDRQPLELYISIGETSTTEFYRWKIPSAINVAESSSSDDDDLFDTSCDDDISDTDDMSDTALLDQDII